MLLIFMFILPHETQQQIKRKLRNENFKRIVHMRSGQKSKKRKGRYKGVSKRR